MSTRGRRAISLPSVTPEPSTIAGPVDSIPPEAAGSARLGWTLVTTGPDTDGLRPVDVLTVVSVAAVTPSVRRVVLSGAPDAVAAAGPTVNVLVPRVDDPSPRWPRIQRDGRIVWPDGSHGVALRSYTARRQDPDAGIVEIDFVLHGDGPAATWAAAARPGPLLARSSLRCSRGCQPAGAIARPRRQ